MGKMNSGNKKAARRCLKNYLLIPDIEEGKDGSNNELIDECIAVCGSRNVIVVRSMLMHLFVVLAYADNDSKTVLLHLIRRPMTEMAS